MADADPMVLTTLDMLENGPLEDWADTSEPADGWGYSKAGSQEEPTKTRQSGSRTGGSGSYFQRLDYSSILVAELGNYWQKINLLGNPNLDGNGHKGITFTTKVWGRKVGSAAINMKIRIIERTSGDVYIAQYDSGIQSMGTSWAELTFNHAITNNACAIVQVQAHFWGMSTGYATIDLDDFEHKTSYTFARNPSMPDDQRLSVPGRKFRRSIAGDLLRSRSGASVAKHEKRLVFGLIGLDQVKALRSLALLDVPLSWQPFHPHLPDNLNVRIVNDIDFTTQAAFGTNAYQGTLVLSEI